VYKQLTLEMAASIFIGMDLGPTTRPMNVAFENMVAASMSRIRLPWIGREFQRGLRGRRFMLDLLGGMLEKKHSDAGADMFSRLCRARTEEGESLGDSDVLDHMIFLMMAAHDTTTSTLSSLTYELAKHPEWQERVREESRALGKGEPGFDEAGTLESLDMAMHETLRRYPPLPVIPRINTYCGVRIRGLPDPRRLHGRGLADPHPPHERVVERSLPLGPGSILVRAGRTGST
jgi:cytochrome P450